MATGTKRTRDNVNFEPLSPIRIIIHKEGDGGYGARTRYLESCVIAKSGWKYPDLIERYKILYEERMGKPFEEAPVRRRALAKG